MVAWAATSAQGAVCHPERIYLSGTGVDDQRMWDFTCNGGMNAGKPGKIGVPCNWELQGYGDYTYGRWYTVKGAEPSKESGVYATTFATPKHGEKDRVMLWMDGVMTDCKVKVNGHDAGGHQGGFYRFGLDITDFLNAGEGSENRLEVTVDKHSANKSINAAERKADWWLFGGIYRPVWLEVEPTDGFGRYLIDARCNGRLKVVAMMGPNVEPGSTLTVRVADNNGREAGRKSVKLNGEKEATVELTVADVKPWTPESPTLYDVRLTMTDAEGKTIKERHERTGFRTIEFFAQDGLYLNGTRLILKGVNRHSFSADGGRATSAAMSVDDALLIKDMNMNAVRSHYPPDEHFLDACDSLGLLYIDELAGWHDKYDNEVGPKLLEEMMARDANHTCVIVWSNGNEGGWNTRLDKEFARHDSLQQRHVIHPWADFNDLDTHHYPAYLTGVGRFVNGHKVFMPTEFMHAMYDQGGGAGLRDFWDRWMTSPLFAGGFIWAFCDEAPARSDRNGALDSDGSNAPDGLVGPRREKEGSFYAVRAQWSPIRLKPVNVNRHFDGTLKVANEYLYTNLSDCKMEWRLTEIAGDSITELGGGEVKIPSIAPGETGTVELSGFATDPRADVLELTACGPDGRQVAEWSLPVGKIKDYLRRHPITAAKRAGKKAKKASVTTDEGRIVMSANGVKVAFDTANGEIAWVESNGKKAALSHGPRATGMKMVYQPEKSGYRTEADGSAVYTARYRGGVDSIVWRLTRDGLLEMDAVMLNRSGGGGGFDDAFMDTEVYNLGLTFSYADSVVDGMTWVGRGPFRVWKNRMEGTRHGLWSKKYNNTVTGETYENLIYPEFKGYHGEMYSARLESREVPMTVHSRSDGIYYHIFTPEEPKGAEKKTMPEFPEGDLSFLLDIPAIASFKPIEQQGPGSQPGNIRIKKGDEGLRINLTFDFTQR